MHKNIMKDPLFLSQKSSVADPKADAQVVRDLQDTLRANRDRCVGMAANMIGVSDIAKEAGINRGTFYLHYVDKFDMIDQLIDEILQNIIFLLNKDQPKTKEEAFAPIVKIFEYLKEDFDFIHAISLNRFNYTSHLVRNFLLELSKQIGPIKETIKTVYPLPEDYAAEVFIYSNSAIFFHWIQKGGVESPEEIAKIFFRMSV